MEDVAEPNRQAIDHVKIISDFRFLSIQTALSLWPRNTILEPKETFPDTYVHRETFNTGEGFSET